MIKYDKCLIATGKQIHVYLHPWQPVHRTFSLRSFVYKLKQKQLQFVCIFAQLLPKRIQIYSDFYAGLSGVTFYGISQAF